MNAAQIDLILNHLPIVATVIGTPVLLACVGIANGVAARVSPPGPTPTR